MKLIVGLGNPGARYANTRHNMGFWVIDELSKRWELPLTRHKFQAKYSEGLVLNKKVVLVQPQTFMNRSGESVRGFLDFYRLELDDLLVIYDDLALQPGYLRLKGAGSAGGHNGVANIIHHLGTKEFPRLRIGIGQVPPYLTSADYVLQKIDEHEIGILQKACHTGADAVEMWLQSDLLSVMNQYNRKQTNGSN